MAIQLPTHSKGRAEKFKVVRTCSGPMKKEVPVTRRTELLEGVDFSTLDEGSVIDLETKSRHYRIEYLGDDQARISGHPQLCPTPVLAQLQGSIGHSGIESGFIRQGMRLVFRRLDDHVPITTSEITGIRVEDQG
jgi:hypothetical protein